MRQVDLDDLRRVMDELDCAGKCMKAGVVEQAIAELKHHRARNVGGDGGGDGLGDGRRICEALGFDPVNHHNALKCPYCNPDGLVLAKPAQNVGAGVG